MFGAEKVPTKNEEDTHTYTGPIRIDDLGWTDLSVRAVMNGMLDSNVWSVRCVQGANSALVVK